MNRTQRAALDGVMKRLRADLTNTFGEEPGFMLHVVTRSGADKLEARRGGGHWTEEELPAIISNLSVVKSMRLCDMTLLSYQSNAIRHYDAETGDYVG